MSELSFCRQFLTALDSRPIKLSSDHIADARNYPAQPAFILPKLPPPHPAKPTPKSTSTQTNASSTDANTISITLKPMKPSSSHPPTTVSVSPSSTSIYDLKTAYTTSAPSVAVSKIKILFNKKPVADSKTVAEVVGDAKDVEFTLMIMGGGAAASGPKTPDVKTPEPSSEGGPAAQGPSGKEVVAQDKFWDDLKGFVVQRIRDESEGERLVGLFKGAWENNR